MKNSKHLKQYNPTITDTWVAGKSAPTNSLTSVWSALYEEPHGFLKLISKKGLEIG